VALWFHSNEAVGKLFTSKFYRSSLIKSRAFHIVVQFMPLMLWLDRLLDLREFEETNGMDEGEVLCARWIKPIARRSTLQTCGHLILSFSSQVPANEALRDRLFVCHKKVYTEKCKRELLCCLKCHGWNHLTIECQEAHDTCRMCAHRHCTAMCPNLDKPFCVP